jgi:hypothetical protein
LKRRLRLFPLHADGINQFKARSSSSACPDTADGRQPGRLAAEQHFPFLTIRGFGDVDFSATNQQGLPSSSGFSLGEFVLHLASPLSRKINVFGEISFLPEHENVSVDLERAFIRYDYNDRFKISFGRHHTPIDYWNTAFIMELGCRLRSVAPK